ncbi:MAG: hypothetical protein A3J83_08190 [Elusimicrobia bacterium RIFOXYA2_FULL_40_6]|nr:MAG: hypothetical protein A3J83_08190 [Elusimicrobia bacterium RIFOXYA2_FULL_40_6]
MPTTSKIDPKEKLILIVDDDDTVVDFLKFAIERDGFRTETARNGDEAIAKAQSVKPDLIVLDMMLPQKAGYEVIKMLQTGQNWKIPIIVVSGRFIEDTFKNNILFEENVKEYLVKPIKSQFLLHKIHSLLGTYSLDEQAVIKNSELITESLKPKKPEGIL